jgi:hypothetical protein
MSQIWEIQKKRCNVTVHFFYEQNYKNLFKILFKITRGDKDRRFKTILKPLVPIPLSWYKIWKNMGLLNSLSKFCIMKKVRDKANDSDEKTDESKD